jgi:hypothetical protein
MCATSVSTLFFTFYCCGQKCSDADCGLFGATLGCRVKKCKKNFHYPCADKLAVKLHVRMWDGMKLPVACKEHRHANQVCMDYKPKKKRKSLKKGLPFAAFMFVLAAQPPLNTFLMKSV